MSQWSSPSFANAAAMLNTQLQRETVVMILGGGQGTRLFPLTRERSKPAVPLGGKFRFIDVALSNSINSGLRQIFVLTQHNSASLNNHVLRTYRFDAFAQGFVAILAAEQSFDMDRGWFQGTADAVRYNLRYLKDPSFRNVLLVPGDHLVRLNFAHLLEMHERSDADITLCAAVVKRDDAQNFRVFKLAPDGRVTDLVRKPQDPETLARFRMTPDDYSHHGVRPDGNQEGYLASMGIYLCKREVLSQLLEESEDQDLGRETLPRMVHSLRSYCYVFGGYWRDIGTIRNYFEASIALTSHQPPFHFFDPEMPIYTHPRFLPPARILGTQLDDALLAEGVLVRNSHIQRSVIGVRAHVDEDCRIEQSVLFGADAFEGENRRAAAMRGDGLPHLGVGPGCHIRKAIIDKNVRIGRDCQLINANNIQHFDGDNYFIRDGVIIVPKGAILPPGTII